MDALLDFDGTAPAGRVALIGFGAIGRDVVAGLRASHLAPLKIGVLLRATSSQALPEDVARLNGLSELFAFSPALVIEAAGAESIHASAQPILAAGHSLLISSVGALADDSLYERLAATARRAGSRLLIPSGAIASLDYLAAVRSIEGTEVFYESRKPPSAWREQLSRRGIDAAMMSEPLVLFSGSARCAASLFPKNLNVAATLALAGIGLDRTRVEVIVDPSARGNRHTIRISGPAGTLETQLANRPSPDNPRSSWIVAKSIVATAERYLSPGYF